MKDSKRRRTQVDFSPESFERLEAIKELAEAKTIVEVVRDAVRFYGWFLRIKQEGYALQLVKDGMVKEVEIFL